MNEFEDSVHKELGDYVSRYLHYETYTLRSLLVSIALTPSPKALELRDGNRIALIYSQDGRIVHAIESNATLEGEAFKGRDAIQQIVHYNSVNFREFHCEEIHTRTLDLLPHEVFDKKFMGEDLSINSLTQLLGNISNVEMAILLRDNSGHNIFYTTSPDNYTLLTQSMLSYCRDLLNHMRVSHFEKVDNIHFSVENEKFKRLLIKQFDGDYILIFLKSQQVPEELLTPFEDII